MVSVELEFENGSLDRVLATLLSLPSSLRPTQLSDDEADVSRRVSIDDRPKFAAFFKGRTTGFFLFGPTLNCLATTGPSKSIRLFCSIAGDPALAKQFLTLMAAARPIFGFACVPEERQYRNRVVTKQGVNTIESWVGRDPQRYIPGLYWLTLLPEGLVKKHDLPLSTVEKIAQEHIELEGGQHFFRFYERPEDWQSVPGVAELISSLPGVFNVEKIKPQLAVAKNYLDLRATLERWR